MIAIVSPSSRERAALIALCESQGWVAVECDSVRAALRLIEDSPPRALCLRHLQADGYSDQVLAALAAAPSAEAPRSIVVVAAGTPSAVEARQLDLGADCVMRDPIRTDVLLAYLAKYHAAASRPRNARRRRRAPPTAAFAGGAFHRADRLLLHDGRRQPLTPREVELVDLLASHPGEVVTYETLYGEILRRPFRGDTSNMRVLLGKLIASAAAIGLALRSWIEVIPKSGYRYRQAAAGAPGPKSTVPSAARDSRRESS